MKVNVGNGVWSADGTLFIKRMS